MAIAELTAILPRPSLPTEVEEMDWAAVEMALGVSLPIDYKAYIEAFGTGRIDGFLWIFNPFSVRDTVALRPQIDVRLGALRELAAMGIPPSHPLFPDPGGLLPVGATDNGEVLYWRTKDAPDDWTIVVCEARGPEYTEHAHSLTGFLTALLMKSERSRVFPRSFPAKTHSFEAK